MTLAAIGVASLATRALPNGTPPLRSLASTFALVGRAVVELAADVPNAVARWSIGPWPVVPLRLPTTRDEALQTMVALGGALLLAYAAWSHTVHRATAVQVRGLAMAGTGFLLSALASSSLRSHGALGPVVSLVGVALVFRASQALVRERQAQRDAEARRMGRHDLPPGDGPRG